MQIVKSDLTDLDLIFDFYEDAIAFQKKNSHLNWLGFERKMVAKAINENRHYKIIDQNEVACIFTIAFSDPEIWKERDTDPAVYLHQIVTLSKFRGRGYVKTIIEWSKNYCKKNGLKYIRMDTWGDHQKLKEYYVRCGFNFLGLTQAEPSTQLPDHYTGAWLSLFEIEL